MDKTEALALFEPFLKQECYTCKAKPGELCNTPVVWVHAVRMIDLRHKQPVKI